MRIFLAHKKGVDEGVLTQWKDRIANTLLTDGVPNAEVITGLEDFSANIANDGSFGAWAANVIERRDNFTGKRIYDAVFTLGYRLGKATAQIVGAAMHHNVPVVVCDELDCGTVEYKRATQLIVEDSDNYTDGWWLDTH